MSDESDGSVFYAPGGMDEPVDVVSTVVCGYFCVQELSLVARVTFEIAVL
jgi:hypothetical protein